MGKKATARISVTGWKPINTKFKRQLNKTATKGMKDATKDLGMVAQSLAPEDTGKLTNSMTTDVRNEGKTVVGSVMFVAFNKGFNYAVWTHEMVYNLGPISLLKSPKPSKYGNYRGYVGTGYAIRPAQQLAPAYNKHIAELITKAFNK